MTDESRDVDAPDAAADDTDAAPLDTNDEREGTEDETTPTRSAATDELWEEVGISPVKIALPRELVGYTLRAYRPAEQLAPAEAAATEDEDEDDPFAARERARAAEDAERAAAEWALAEEAEAADGTDKPDGKDRSVEEPAPEDFLDEDEESTEHEVSEDVPVFLSHRGKLLLFATPESLLSFIQSGAEHDLSQLDSWPTLVKRVRVEDLVPTEDDTYELDLVVENLRGGHSAWELPLLISAGEIARDLGYALRLEPVLTALAPGSPLDDLDDAVRSAAAGGVGRFLAKRRLRRIGAQQASLGWRTIIGKISAAVDWRD